MKTDLSTSRPKPVAAHPVERLPTHVRRPVPAERLGGTLAAQVCNRTFGRYWVRGPVVISSARF